MIMGLERLDRITAFMEEQAGPMRPVEFPPPRYPGPPSTIREEPEAQPPSVGGGQELREQNGSHTASSGSGGSSSNGTPPLPDGSIGPEQRGRLASSAGASTSAAAASPSGRERVNAAVAAVGKREELAQRAPSVSAVDSRRSSDASLDGQARLLPLLC